VAVTDFFQTRSVADTPNLIVDETSVYELDSACMKARRNNVIEYSRVDTAAGQSVAKYLSQSDAKIICVDSMPNEQPTVNRCLCCLVWCLCGVVCKR
jgi:hypothetical protein